MTKDGIMNLEEILSYISQNRSDDIIGLTNGCFDLIHVGHVRYLQEAKSLVDKLIVAVNSDDSVAKLKGENRPIIPLAERMEILAALESVDLVTSFDEYNCKNVISKLCPDVYIKGGDYDSSTLPEWETVQQIGGEVKFIDLTSSKSTTQIIERILSSHHS